MADPYEFDRIKWDGAGYFGCPSYPPERGLPEPGASPWEQWAACLAHAREGDLAVADRLLALRVATNDPVLRQCCYYLLGDAGPGRVFGPIRDDLSSSDLDRVLFAAGALTARGNLADIPLLLGVFERFGQDPDAIMLAVHIKDLLGAEGPDEPDGPPTADYRERVLAAQAELADRLGTVDVFVFQGERLSAIRVAEKLLEAAQRPVFSTLYRRRFEAMTGIDCSGFYRDRRFQPLAAAAIVEGFLEGPAASQFEDGVRYFFGHRIPD